jgi:hypothetical protein
MRNLFVTLFLLSCSFSFGQTPGVKWANTMGGPATDRGYKVLTGADSSYFFLGETSSTSGDITDNHGNQDIWIIKTDKNGIVQWNKCFGGSDIEQFRDAILNNDGTVTVIAISKSNDGNVSSNHGGWIYGCSR